jgi:hypothetical protein
VKPSTETALYLCGRDRVLHREGRDPAAAVAIRWDSPGKITAPDGTQTFLVGDGKDLDEAGRAAARMFAERIRSVASDLNEWAARIERALDGDNR